MSFNPMESKPLSNFSPLTEAELDAQHQAQVQDATQENLQRQRKGLAPDPVSLFTQYFEEQVALHERQQGRLNSTQIDAIADQVVEQIQLETDQWLAQQPHKGINACITAAGAQPSPEQQLLNNQYQTLRAKDDNQLLSHIHQALREREQQQLEQMTATRAIAS